MEAAQESNCVREGLWALPQVLQVEDIPTQRIGSVVACVAPLFSHRPDIHHWMHHYTQLGVNRFHMWGAPAPQPMPEACGSVWGSHPTVAPRANNSPKACP